VFKNVYHIHLERMKKKSWATNTIKEVAWPEFGGVQGTGTIALTNWSI
jgi:hypothetical protein